MSTLSVNDIETLAGVAELKRLYAGAAHSMPSEGSASLVVTSAVPREGKTTMAAVLAAISARQGGRRTVVIDLNWHRPALHECFDLKRSFDVEGLKDGQGLSGQVQPSGMEGLDVLTAPDDVRVNDPLAHALTILKRAREEYDFVVMDTSALFPTNRRMIDPVILSAAADGVALVVLAAVTPRQEVKRSYFDLKTAKANVVGTIVNQWQNPLVTK